MLFIALTFIQLVNVFANDFRSEVLLSSAIEVSPRESISLYDLAEAKQISEQDLDQLKDIIVAEKGIMEIQRADLVKKVRGLRTRFIIPETIKIIRTQQKVSRLEVERKIKNKLVSQCKSCDFLIRINSVPVQIGSNWELDLNTDLSKAVNLISIYSDNSAQGWVTAEIKKYALVPITLQVIKAGEVITSDMLRFEKRNIRSFSEGILDVNKMIGMQSTRYISTGQQLSLRDLKKENVLRKGQMVKARVGQEAYEITISAVAEEAGAIGDYIKVKNMESQKYFSARIVEKGLVEIE